MARSLIIAISVLVVLLSSAYQFLFKPILSNFGFTRSTEEVGNTDCKVIPELEACEKTILHQSTGVLYLACSTLRSRLHWAPGALVLNATGRSQYDYVATYDPKNSRITRLTMPKLPEGLSVHGMDVVPSEFDPKELFVYLVNHQPFTGKDPLKHGANSTIEIFKTRVGGSALTHMHTVSDQAIVSPNDVVGSSDGKSFYFTNDAAAKTGFKKRLQWALVLPLSTVGYCHIEEGCKFVTPRIFDANGITHSNNTFYVTSTVRGSVTAYERQSNNDLIPTNVVRTGHVLDNVSIDTEGMLWVAALPKLLLMFKHMHDPSLKAPSSALRINPHSKGSGVSHEHVYKVDKLFEDKGDIISGVTSVVHDAERRRLFLHGWSSHQLAVCNI